MIRARFGIQEEVFAIGVAFEEAEADMNPKALAVEVKEHPAGLLVELHGLGCARSFVLREAG